MHEIKQAVNYMGPELLLRNTPPPPASNFVHFLFIIPNPKLLKHLINQNESYPELDN